MMVVVQGTNEFADYGVFLRAMSVALSGMQEDDKYFYIYSLGPSKINSFAQEFVNLSERGMKARNKKIKTYRVTQQWFTENISDFNYFAYLSGPKQYPSSIAKFAKDNGIELGIFQY